LLEIAVISYIPGYHAASKLSTILRAIRAKNLLRNSAELCGTANRVKRGIVTKELLHHFEDRPGICRCAYHQRVANCFSSQAAGDPRKTEKIVRYCQWWAVLCVFPHE